MNKNLVFTVASLLSLAPAAHSATAADSDAPAMCKNLAIHATLLLNTAFTDSSGYSGSAYNPSSLVLDSNKSGLVIGRVTDLGNCDTTSGLDPKWCTGFGGGSFEIFKIEVVDKQKYPEGEVIVNYNSRGACIVREVQTPEQN